MLRSFCALILFLSLSLPLSLSLLNTSLIFELVILQVGCSSLWKATRLKAQQLSELLFPPWNNSSSPLLLSPWLLWERSNYNSIMKWHEEIWPWSLHGERTLLATLRSSPRCVCVYVRVHLYCVCVSVIEGFTALEKQRAHLHAVKATGEPTLEANIHSEKQCLNSAVICGSERD